MSLSSLPPELLNIIFEWIFEVPDDWSDMSPDSDVRAIKALCRTDRYCYSVAKPIFYRSVSLSTRDALKLIARTLTTDPEIVPLVEALHLNLYTENQTYKPNIVATPSVLHMFTYLRDLSLYDFHDAIDHLPQSSELFPYLEYCSLRKGEITHLASLKSLWIAPKLQSLALAELTCSKIAGMHADTNLVGASPVRSALMLLRIGDIRNFSIEEAHMLANLRPVRRVILEGYEETINPPTIKLIESLSPHLTELCYRPSVYYIQENYLRLELLDGLTTLGIAGLNLLYTIQSAGGELPGSIEELNIDVQCDLLLNIYTMLEDVIRKRNRCTSRLRQLRIWCFSGLALARSFLGPDVEEIEGGSDTMGIDISRLQQHQELKLKCEQVGVALAVEDWSSDFEFC